MNLGAMGFRILYRLQYIPSFNSILAARNGRSSIAFGLCSGLLQGNTNSIVKEQIRTTAFLITLSAEQLWKGVTSVSNAGRKRGRGRAAGRIIAKNLNRGQVIGVGKSNMVWPGLNAPIIKGRELVQQQQLKPDPDFENNLVNMRNRFQKSWSIKLTPLERGWSGGKMPGRSIGPPDPIGEDTFEGFDTKVLEYKRVFHMTATSGRASRLSAFSITGNQNGLAGFALAKATDGKSAVKKSKNRAGQHLVYIERYNDHTIYHNFFSQFGRTKIFAYKKPEGYGLVCHRALKTMCEVIGIKNMYAKVEGSTKNIQNLTKAFFNGLINQKTHQTMADEVGLNLVELSQETDFFPKVVATPTNKLSPKEQEKRIVEYEDYISQGKVALKRKKHLPFYVGTKGWNTHLKKMVHKRNHEQVEIDTLIRQGSLKSHVMDKSVEELPRIIGVGKPHFTLK